MDRRAIVFYQNRRAGELRETANGYRFTYDLDYLADGVPVSYRLPLREAPYDSETLPAFFLNLVSEGWLRQVQSQTQKIDSADSFGLLLANGLDLVGAVTIKPVSSSA
jgi:serine/threonine-protein kinase HipA